MSDAKQEQATATEFTPTAEYAPVEEVQESAPAGLKIALAAMIVIAGIAALYGWQQHQAVVQAAAERAELGASLSQVKGQEEAMATRLNTLTAERAQEEAARAAAENAARMQAAAAQQLARQHARHVAANRSVPVEDPRWEQFQNQLGAQQKELTEDQQQIAETRANLKQAQSELEANLQSTRTQLGGDIARNHDELVALEKKGERNFYEFSVGKSKTYHHTGPISIALRKADAKHDSCDLNMMIDDREVTRKHVNLYESLNFYPEGYTQALEVVINRIDKDSVQGYVSVPKYQPTRQSASPSAAPATSNSSSPAAAVDTVARAEAQEARAQ